MRLTSSPRVCNGTPRPPPPRQGGLREQLHDGGLQVAGPEHGGGGGGLHVQVPDHTLCLHHPRAAQLREPGPYHLLPERGGGVRGIFKGAVGEIRDLMFIMGFDPPPHF